MQEIFTPDFSDIFTILNICAYVFLLGALNKLIAEQALVAEIDYKSSFSLGMQVFVLSSLWFVFLIGVVITSIHATLWLLPLGLVISFLLFVYIQYHFAKIYGHKVRYKTGKSIGKLKGLVVYATSTGLTSAVFMSIYSFFNL